MNEIEQKFEAYFNVPADKLPELSKAWRAAYEAGEIAMKEKAATRTAEFYLAKGDALDIARAIRALPLSGAEESKKEKA